METRANHLAVGIFVLAVVAGLFGFVLWLGRSASDQELTRYAILFEGSVSGLSASSTVRYRGVPVGRVEDIRIDPENSERIRVTVALARDTPIKTDSVAALELRGVTGLVDVNISGGGRDSPPLAPAPGETLAVIPSRPSQLETLFASVPMAVARITALADRGARLLSDENIAAISAMLQDLNRLTTAIAANSGRIEGLTESVAGAAEEIRSSARSLDALVADLNDRLPALADAASGTLTTADAALRAFGKGSKRITADTEKTLGEVRAAAAALGDTATKLTDLIDENRQGLRDFTGEGLYELTRFLIETRSLVASLTRLANRFESDPARFLFGDTNQGFEPK